jgi:hypothetical protein
MDVLAFELQFIDHVAPVWHALGEVKGRFLTDPALLAHARLRGIEAESVDVQAIRRSSPPPKAVRSPVGPRAFVASIGDTKVGRRLGYRRFAFMEHGIGQAYAGGHGTARHPSYAGGADRDDTELFLVPNDYSAALWQRAYPAARVEVVGTPKLDGLPRRTPGPGPVVAISFHWPAFVAPEAGTALPHYRAVLPGLAKRFEVIGHCHPKADWPTRMERVYRRAGIAFEPDFDVVLRQADAYICDNSSSMYEFAATGRSVVVLNAPTYRRTITHGLRFWEAAAVGINVDEPAQLIAAIERALEQRPDDVAERERALDIVYAHRSGGAERAARALQAWAADERAEAA